MYDGIQKLDEIIDNATIDDIKKVWDLFGRWLRDTETAKITQKV